MIAPELAIIVTSFEMPWHLRRALESIACQKTSKKLEVIVADDGSADETPRVVAEFAAGAKFPVRFVTHPHSEFHAARCRNDGVKHSTAPHLLFFDGDCLLPPDHVESHLSARRPGTVTCSYCVRLDGSRSDQATLDTVSSGQFLQWTTPEQLGKLRKMHFKSILYRLIGHATKPAFRSTDFSLARSDFERVNGFDENFRGWGCEDDDFGLRLRAAGVRLSSLLNRTCVYHLWHPPAPTRPAEWKRGANVNYLHRPIRLTRCLRGWITRRPSELTVGLAGRTANTAALSRLLAVHGWSVESSPTARFDLELLCRPGNGRFTGRGDCRLLAVFDESADPSINNSQAHIVLSARGTLGRPDQVRLQLHDTSGLWAVLEGLETQMQRAAA